MHTISSPVPIKQQLHPLLKRLFPICRSITGNGVRQTLAILQEEIPALTIHEVPSGTQVFDWTIPNEWNISSARLTAPSGEIIADFSTNNLHVVGYSIPIDTTLSLEDLQKHLHSRADMPDAIPYVTSYYAERWGFCLKHSERENLQPGLYHAKIESTLAPGSLTYGEIIIPGKCKKEIFLSTYICHPSMANNELSGPVVMTALTKWLLSKPRKYTYRIVFIPETIGSITYLSKNYKELQERTIAGFNLSCMGDERAYSYLPSRKGNTLADKVALHILKHFAPDFISYSFLNRGSDERQYCAPGIDLPLCSIMRSKYGCYPEYHTSLDDCSFVTEQGLQGGLSIIQKAIKALEANSTYSPTILGEPQLGKRGLYPTLSTRHSVDEQMMQMRNILAYTDGETSLLDIAEIIDVDILTCAEIVNKLVEHSLLSQNKI